MGEIGGFLIVNHLFKVIYTLLLVPECRAFSLHIICGWWHLSVACFSLLYC